MKMTASQCKTLQALTTKLAAANEHMDFSILEAGIGTVVFQASNANGPWYDTYKSLTAYIGKRGGVKVYDSVNLSPFMDAWYKAYRFTAA